MNSVEAALRQVTADLDRRRLGWALVGGFAVSARAEPRFTRDVDVAVAVIDDRAAEQNVHDLVAGGYRLLASVEQDAVGRLATVRLSPVAGDVVVDVLFASSGIEPEIVRSAEAIEILPGLVVPVARTGHLIALKLLARDDESRPQDLADLRSLHEVATSEDVDLARSAIHLITERGYHRNRDLAAALTALLSP
ncbi:MAG: nucleotidyl transferase AbiEii/AbiGii toxin family protein [Actinobacteria bacterium]|nr:nucleotidyl transferase AbiEii/AbiGii toxin family protein [Actinomycetota bacterium]